MAMRDMLAVVRVGMASAGVPGMVLLASLQQAIAGTATNRAVTPAGLAAYVANHVSGAPAAPTPAKKPTIVSGPMNTLEVPGLWIRTDAVTGLPTGLFYSDTGNAIDGDGEFVAGPTNTLTGPGLWLKTTAGGQPITLLFDDGNHS